MNSYILNTKFGDKQMKQIEFCETIVHYLLQSATTNEGDEVFQEEETNRLLGKHFPVKLLKTECRELACKVCFVPKKIGQKRVRKMTAYMCDKCRKAMCIESCFKIYHTQVNYKEHLP